MKVKSSRPHPTPPPASSNACPPVTLAWNSTAQRTQQWLQGRLGPAAVLRPLFILCLSLTLMTLNPQQPPAYFGPVLTRALFTPAHNKSTLLGWEIRTQRGGDNGEGLRLGLFRFSLVARLDTTSEWTKGATTLRLSQGLSRLLEYLGSGCLGEGRRHTLR